MSQRPSRVLRSSELKAARGKSRSSLRGEIDDIRSALTKTDEEARRKQAFYDAVSFYRPVTFNIGDVRLARFSAANVVTPYEIVHFDVPVRFNDVLELPTTALDSLRDVLGLYGDTWTPACTISANLDSVAAAGLGTWAKTGEDAAWGRAEFTVDATVAANLCNFRFSLPPIPNGFSFLDAWDLSGVGVGINGVTARIRADVANNEAVVQVVTNSTSPVGVTCVFGFRV